MRRALAVLAVVLVGAPSAARAEPAASEEEARRHFQTATALFEAGDYELALDEFEAAYDAKPHPTVLRNVAATLERLRRYPEAILVLERYLREATGASLRAERATIEEHLLGLRSLVGRIEVVLPTAGFRVVVDGRAVGTSPLAAPVDVALGRRLVVAERDGYEPTGAEVRVEGGQTARVELRPVARMARLIVDTGAPHAAVSVDGAPPMPAPWSNAVMPGVHRVRVTAPGRRPSEVRVNLAPGAERSLVLQLDAGGPQGMLSLEVRPERQARAVVDGLPLELGRGSGRTLEQGLHRVVVEAPDRETYEGTVRVRANRLTRVRVRLDEERFWISPLWGTIAAGGALVSAVGAVYWGLGASGAASDYRDPSTPTQDLGRLYEDRQRFARAADAAIVTTAIVGAGAILLWYWSRQRPESTARVDDRPIQ